jgi:fibronectin-binding autotransporter adhesin
MSGPVKGTRSGGFYKYGSGTLTLSNTGENVAYDDFRVTEGTLVFDGSASTTWKLETGGQYFGAWRGAYLCVGDQNSASNVTMEIHNGSFDINGAVQVAFRGQNNIQATLNMTGGKIDCIYFDLGNCWGTCSAVANLSGNAYVYAHDNTYIGDAAGSTNTLNLSNNAVLETGKYVIMGYNVGTTATTTLDGNSQLIVQSGAKVSIIDPVSHLETADPNDYDGLNVGYHGIATLTVKGNAKVTTAPYMPTTMGLDGNSQGFLNIQDNANLMIGSLRVGERGNAVGVVRQSGGSIGSMNSNNASGEYGSAVVNGETTVLSSWTIGGNIKNDLLTAWSTTSYGYYGLSGGTMSPGPNNYLVVGYTSAGIFDQTGGTLNLDYRFRVGESAGSTGIANIGGTGIVNQRQVWTNTIGVSGYGVMNLSGSGQFNSDYRINLAANAGSTGILNLGAVGTGGGTLSVDWLQKGAGTAAVNFHGGTLVAHATPTTTNWIGLDSTVYGEGAILDSNGLNVTISSKLLAPTGKGVNTIALTNGGAGYVALPAVKISGGLGSGATANAVVDTVTGKVTGFVITNPGQGYGPSDTLTVQFIGGGCTTAATATITSANLAANVSTGGLMKKGSGTLTLTGDNTYGGDTLVNAGTLTLTKALNTPNASVKVATSATLNATSINADSLIIGGGPFAFTPHAAAVPEPGTVVLLALAGLGALLAVWRRK